MSMTDPTRWGDEPKSRYFDILLLVGTAVMCIAITRIAIVTFKFLFPKAPGVSAVPIFFVVLILCVLTVHFSKARSTRLKDAATTDTESAEPADE